MAKSAAVRAEARFKQLCCLDLAGEAIIPALLQELQQYWSPTIGRGSSWSTRASGSPTPMTSTPMLTSPPLSIGRNSTAAAVANWQARSPISYGLKLAFVISKRRRSLKIDPNSFRRSEFYNLIYRTTRIDLFLRLIVREGGRGRPLGVVTMHRAAGEDRWTAEQKRKLGDLEPFLAHAMTTRGKGDALADSGRSGRSSLIEPARSFRFPPKAASFSFSRRTSVSRRTQLSVDRPSCRRR